MTIIDTPSAMARALAMYRNPWLRRQLASYRDRLLEAGCDVGELGPVIVIEPGDTREAIEQAAGVSLVAEPEYCEADHGWAELVFVIDDHGGGLVLLVPERDDIDPALLAMVREHGASAFTYHDHADPPEGQREQRP